MSDSVTVIALPRVRRHASVALGVCLLSFAAFWCAQRAAHVSMIDLTVYRAEGATVRAGGDLYALRTTEAHLPTTYPPFAALLFTPLTLLDTSDLQTLATAGNLALLVVFVSLSLRLVGHARVESVWWTSAAAVWCEPVWTTLRYGQVNLLLGALVLWDLTGRPVRRWAGAGIGIAAAVKLTPALFAVFLLAMRPRGTRAPGPRRPLAAPCARGGRRVHRGDAARGRRPAVRLVALLEPDGVRDGPGRAGGGHREPVAARGPGPAVAQRAPRPVVDRRGSRGGGSGPHGRRGRGTAWAAGLGGGRLRGDGAAGQPGVVVAPLGVVRADDAAPGDPREDVRRRHRRGLLLVRAVVGTARPR